MKKHQSAFILVFAVYIIAGIVAVMLFYYNGSFLSHQPDQQTSAQKAEVPDNQTPNTDSEAVIVLEDTAFATDETVPTPEPEADPAPELEPENETEAPFESEADPALELESENETETPPEPETDPALELEPEDETETPPEPETEPETETEPEKIYYGYTVKSGKTNVRVRKSVERNSSIVGHVNGGDTGYLIKEDGNRSKIVLADGTVGYIYNEYISVSEIPKEDVPEEYR